MSVTIVSLEAGSLRLVASTKKAIPLKRDRLSRTSKNHHCCYFV